MSAAAQLKLEKDLHPLSGLTLQAFSKTSGQLREMLCLDPVSSRRNKVVIGSDNDSMQVDPPSGSVSKRKRDSTGAASGSLDEDERLRRLPSKRLQLTHSLMNPEPSSDAVLSPTRSKSKSTNLFTPLPRSQAASPLRPTSARRAAMEKTPLNLPLKQAPARPMCIFESRPILNPHRNHTAKKPLRHAFDDWNWKSNLFDKHWDSTDLDTWDHWLQTSMPMK